MSMLIWMTVGLVACDRSPPVADDARHQTLPPFEPPPEPSDPAPTTDCATPEVPYNGLDDDCDPSTLDDDLDLDGVGIAEDCDDGDATVFPGAVDIARDGVDQDCTGRDRCSSPPSAGQFLDFIGPSAADEMAALCAQYPDGMVVEYWLSTDETTSSDLTELSCLCEVQGTMSIYGNEELVSLEGLADLEEIEDTLYLFGNDQLASLQGLRSLKRLGYGPTSNSVSGLQLGTSPSLTSLEGLDALEEVKHVSISTLPIRDLTGLGSLERVGNLSITYCWDLETLDGLHALTTVGDGTADHGFTWLYANPSLVSLDGFVPTTIEGALYLYDNDSLEDVSALTGLISIGGDLLIDNLAALEQLDPLHGLEQVDGDLTITNNAAMTQQEGWDLVAAIGTIAGEIEVSGNDTGL